MLEISNQHLESCNKLFTHLITHIKIYSKN